MKYLIELKTFSRGLNGDSGVVFRYFCIKDTNSARFSYYKKDDYAVTDSVGEKYFWDSNSNKPRPE